MNFFSLFVHSVVLKQHQPFFGIFSLPCVRRGGSVCCLWRTFEFQPQTYLCKLNRQENWRSLPCSLALCFQQHGDKPCNALVVPNHTGSPRFFFSAADYNLINLWSGVVCFPRKMTGVMFYPNYFCLQKAGQGRVLGGRGRKKMWINWREKRKKMDVKTLHLICDTSDFLQVQLLVSQFISLREGFCWKGLCVWMLLHTSGAGSGCGSSSLLQAAQNVQPLMGHGSASCTGPTAFAKQFLPKHSCYTWTWTSQLGFRSCPGGEASLPVTRISLQFGISRWGRWA